MPVDPAKIDEFSPETVPTVGQLLNELDQAKVVEGGEHHSGMWILIMIQMNLSIKRMSNRLGEDVAKTLRGNAGQTCPGTDERGQESQARWHR